MNFNLLSLDHSRNRYIQPSWMVTYCDTLSLLVAFFVMLMAFSLSGTRMVQAIDSARTSLGGKAQKEEYDKNFKSSITALDPLIEKILANYAAFRARNLNDLPFYFAMHPEGISLVLNGKDFFQQGTAIPVGDSYSEVYDALSALSGITSNKIKILSILSHNTVVNSRHTKTQWGLASERGLFVSSKIKAHNPGSMSRILVGIRINSEEEEQKLSQLGFPLEQVQIIFCDLRDVEEMLPKEVLYME